MRERIFSDFIVKKSIDRKLSDEELDAIQSGEMSGLLRCFYNITAPQKHSLFECTMKVMERSLRVVSLEDIVKSNRFQTNDFVIHTIEGDIQGLLGFCGSRAAMRLLALDYVEREQEFLEEEHPITPAQVREGIECLIREIFLKFLGVYQRDFGGELHLSEAVVGSNAVLECASGFYVLTFKILGKEVNMIMGIMGDIRLTLDGDIKNE